MRANDREDLLSVLPSSASMSFADAWEQHVGQGSSSLYSPGVQFLEQGSESSEIYFIRDGLIKLQSIDQEGQQAIIGLRRAGRVVGTEAALLGKPHLVSALTVTECSLQRLPTDRFLGLVRAHPGLSWHLHQISAGELRETTIALMEAKSQPADTRLKRLVLELAPELHQLPVKQTAVRLPFKQGEVAQLLGITPEHLSRLLRRLEKEWFLGRKRVIQFACA